MQSWIAAMEQNGPSDFHDLLTVEAERVMARRRRAPLSSEQRAMLKRAIQAGTNPVLAIVGAAPHAMTRARGLERRGFITLHRLANGKAIGMIATDAGRTALAEAGR